MLLPVFLLNACPALTSTLCDLHPSTRGSVPTVCSSDRGDVLRRGGGLGAGLHRDLPGTREQRHGVQPPGAPEQRPGHQHGGGGGCGPGTTGPAPLGHRREGLCTRVVGEIAVCNVSIDPEQLLT